MQKIPETIHSKSIYKNDFLEIKVDTLDLNNNIWEQAYFVKPNKNGVGILPIDDKGVYLVNQYRHASHMFLWQIPLGQIDKGSTALATAKTELREEAGIVAKKITKIGSFIAEPGMTNQKMFIYVAEGLSFHKQHNSITEIGMQTKHFTFQEVKEMIRTEKLLCGFTICALYLLENNSSSTLPK